MLEVNIRDTLQNVRTLLHADPSAMLAGQVVVANRQVIVALNDLDADVEGAYMYQGKAEFPKTTGITIDVGEVCFWDEGNRKIDKDATGRHNAGICVEAAAIDDTTVVILLLPSRNKIRGISVTVAAAATSGSSAADTTQIKARILGILPTGNQDQLVDNVVVNGDGSITVTLAAAATADNTFSVTTISA